MDEFIRAENLIGKQGQKKLCEAKVAVFGLGGVGSYVAEALARAGIGEILLVDGDVIALSNINRQLIALHSTVGKSKVSIMEARILDINPNARVVAKQLFYAQDNCDKVDVSGLDYVVDAIDTVSSKLCLIENCKQKSVSIISAMGAGNKLDPTAFKVADI
ncbi:MAG: tRNA threonylcarbamoyladenosine dehydratase, partial [Clostridia bacterium]